MNKRLIDDANMRVKQEDTCIHVGDFCVKGARSKHQQWRDRLHGHWVFLRGNHDPNNGVKTVGSSMLTRIGIYNVFVSHIPWWYEDWFAQELRDYVAKHCDFAICGHIHEKWANSYEKDNEHLADKRVDRRIPCINVGVDVRNFRPISDDEIINEYLKIRKGGK